MQRLRFKSRSLHFLEDRLRLPSSPVGMTSHFWGAIRLRFSQMVF